MFLLVRSSRLAHSAESRGRRLVVRLPSWGAWLRSGGQLQANRGWMRTAPQCRSGGARGSGRIQPHRARTWTQPSVRPSPFVVAEPDVVVRGRSTSKAGARVGSGACGSARCAWRVIVSGMRTCHLYSCFLRPALRVEGPKSWDEQGLRALAAASTTFLTSASVAAAHLASGYPRAFGTGADGAHRRRARLAAPSRRTSDSCHMRRVHLCTLSQRCGPRGAHGGKGQQVIFRRAP